jgi:hypothetical protein
MPTLVMNLVVNLMEGQPWHELAEVVSNFGIPPECIKFMEAIVN